MRHVTLSLSVLGVLMAGCGILGPDSPDLEWEIAMHRAMWEANRPAGYEYVVERLCYCLEGAIGKVRVHVEGDSVTSRMYADGRGEVASELAALFPDVDGLFGVLEDALDRGADGVDVTWDNEIGVPVAILLDYDKFTVDDEVTYRVPELPKTGQGT